MDEILVCAYKKGQRSHCACILLKVAVVVIYLSNNYRKFISIGN